MSYWWRYDRRREAAIYMWPNRKTWGKQKALWVGMLHEERLHRQQNCRHCKLSLTDALKLEPGEQMLVSGCCHPQMGLNETFMWGNAYREKEKKKACFLYLKDSLKAFKNHKKERKTLIHLQTFKKKKWLYSKPAQLQKSKTCRSLLVHQYFDSNEALWLKAQLPHFCEF